METPEEQEPIERRLEPLNVGTDVPVPTPIRRSLKGHRRRWPWAVAVFTVLVIGFASIRGDSPTTVIVADGSVVPIEEVAPGGPPETAPYSMVDPTAGENLKVCAWDYCLVHDEIGDQRMDPFKYEITLKEAQAIANEVTDQWGVASAPISSQLVPGEVAGYYNPNDQTITLDQPIFVWILLHELAHHIVTERDGPETLSHGTEFLATLDALAGSQ